MVAKAAHKSLLQWGEEEPRKMPAMWLGAWCGWGHGVVGGMGTCSADLQLDAPAWLSITGEEKKRRAERWHPELPSPL